MMAKSSLMIKNKGRRELKESRPSIWRERFILAGLPEPSQLNLDKGQDINKFYNLTKRR